ncbi:uncharacterized protein N7473_013333 [Penicillium subrubescens]|uniref:uncharacterized protein n=1 Tax=Penicillium subrubescens TaxID=1316194 RepID=UPI0025453F59|nr:uncharacterized protein N7473_013333 [Penicillium subrubescens]KAJ5873460.1 hypothetical protein N7473_013333 [Penicillium subrubescens]
MPLLNLIGGDRWGSVEIRNSQPKMDQSTLKNTRALMLNNATARSTMTACPTRTALVENRSPLTQGHSNTIDSEHNWFGEAEH